MTINLKQQKGVVLILTLVILILITLMSTAQLQQAGQQIKMVNNAQQRHLTFQAADSALLQTTVSLIKQLDVGAEIIDSAVVTINNNLLSTDNMSVSVTYRAHIINNISSNSPLDTNDNLPNIQTIHFIITSTAYIHSSGVKTVLEKRLAYEQVINDAL